jgi:hypothetical protein
MSVSRVIVITPLRVKSRKYQLVELVNYVQQIPNVLPKYRALIATYRKEILPELVFFLTRLARRVHPIHFAVLMELPMDNNASTTATPTFTRLHKKTELV